MRHANPSETTRNLHINNIQASEAEETTMPTANTSDNFDTTPNSKIIPTPLTTSQCDRCEMSSKRIRQLQDNLRKSKKRNARLNQELHQQKQVIGDLKRRKFSSHEKDIKFLFKFERFPMFFPLRNLNLVLALPKTMLMLDDRKRRA